MSFINKPNFVKKPFGVNGIKNIIQEETTNSGYASYDKGFPDITFQPKEAGGLPPRGQDMNGILNQGGSQFDLYSQMGGTYGLNLEILANGGYSKGCVVWEDIGVYRSLSDSNTDNFKTDPSVIGSTWQLILDYNQQSGTNGVPGQLSYFIRKDAPTGWLRCDGNEYLASAFIGLEDLILADKVAWVDFTQYNVELSNNNDNCGYIGYDSVNRIIRVPKIKDGTYIMQALTSGLGSFTAAGLPNIIGQPNIFNLGENSTNGKNGCVETIIMGNGRDQGGTGSAAVIKINASWSNPIYGNSDTVQTNAISYPLFICISNVAVPASEAQYNGFIDGLSNKINIDGSNATFNNISIEAIKNIVEINTLDFNKGVNITTNITYTVPDNGWLRLYAPTGSSVGYKSNLDKEQDITYSLVNNLSIGENIYFKISKDEVINRTFLTGGAKSYFYYNK